MSKMVASLPLVIVDQEAVTAVYARGGEDVFAFWWAALGVVVRLAVIAKAQQRRAGRRTATPSSRGR